MWASYKYPNSIIFIREILSMYKLYTAFELLIKLTKDIVKDNKQK